MTSPESITVSLKWAKKLYDCGWSGPSYWLWAFHCFDFPDDSQYQKPMLISRDTEDHHHQWDMYSAPTWSDIWFSLPPDLRLYEKEVAVTLDAEFLDEWNPAIFKIEEYRQFQSRRIYPPALLPKESSPHDDVAAMYCYLAEQKLLPSAA